MTSSQSRGLGKETRIWTEMESTSLVHHDPVFPTTAALGITALLTWGTEITEGNPDYLARNTAEDINWKKVTEFKKKKTLKKPQEKKEKLTISFKKKSLDFKIWKRSITSGRGGNIEIRSYKHTVHRFYAQDPAYTVYTFWVKGEKRIVNAYQKYS